jgi:hypothetical protein
MSNNETEIAKGTFNSDVPPPKRIFDQLLERFFSLARNRAENTIELAQTLYEADEYLGKYEIREFCKRVNLSHEGSTYRKMRKIGQEASRFKPFTEQLPSGWTTLYRLAKLSNDQFDRVTKHERFRPMMTAADVDDITGQPSKHSNDRKRDVTIDMTGLDNKAKLDVYHQIKDLEQKFGFHIKIAEEIEALVKSPVSAAGSAK